MDFYRLKLLLQTIRHVKFTQLYHQVLYRFVRKADFLNPHRTAGHTDSIQFKALKMVRGSFRTEKRFSFLNINHSFEEIDWNYFEYGKLWTYNLNYFDFLQQSNMTKEIGLTLILDFCSKSSINKDAYEPYPISLRAINWVKFLSQHEIDDPRINEQLLCDLYKLNRRLEYHILANHLFENGFGLLFGAYFFKDELLYKNAVKIIRSELKEQILNDGAHYELSPMYHQIILYRILDCYQLVSKNSWKNNELAMELKDAAKRMLGWMRALQFSDGGLPLVNDSAVHIAPTTEELFSYAGILDIETLPIQLSDSGYRKFINGNLELLFDAAEFLPPYQPGHAHADSLHILLNKNGVQVLVDSGISTYEKNERRLLERSTRSHNTVTVDLMNSSEVWSGFRVGRRARVNIIQEDENGIRARHDGYRNLGIIHERSAHISPAGFVIRDTMKGATKNRRIEGHLHFHPDRLVTIQNSSIIVDGKHFIDFRGQFQLHMEDYQYCLGFNQLTPGKKIVYEFTTEVTMLFII